MLLQHLQGWMLIWPVLLESLRMDAAAAENFSENDFCIGRQHIREWMLLRLTASPKMDMISGGTYRGILELDSSVIINHELTNVMSTVLATA